MFKSFAQNPFNSFLKILVVICTFGTALIIPVVYYYNRAYKFIFKPNAEQQAIRAEAKEKHQAEQDQRNFEYVQKLIEEFYGDSLSDVVLNHHQNGSYASTVRLARQAANRIKDPALRREAHKMIHESK